ncbi:RNA metabolism protein [Lithospermum erythrorhizon]|uniref:RNA metabolism protein n=1 Tax=Lithospermum erythrorhizon TaxID=34254 RepID=A0AAV3PMU4_LITER
MAEEEVIVAPEVALADNSNKRKLEELDLTKPPSGDCTADESVVVQDADAENGKNEDISNVSEAKRPRLEEWDHAGDNGFEKAKDDNVPNEEVVHPTRDGHDEPKEVPDGGSSELPADGEQPPIGIEEPADVADQEPSKEEASKEETSKEDASKEETSKEDGHQVIADVDQKGVNDQHEVDTETVTQKMEVPNNRVGVLIGKAGDTIRYLQYNSGAKIQITRDVETDPHSTSRLVELIGTLESIKKAEKLIKDVIAEADAGGSPSLVARGFSTVQTVTGEQLEIQVPNEKVGLIIGKGGETIKNLQTSSGARIQLIPQHPPEGDQFKERTVRVTGDRKQIEIAREMIKEVMNQIVRPSPLSGGHGQPALRPRGPVAPQWGSHGAHLSHFTGYDRHRGPYPSHGQQYPPPMYGNYPPQSASRLSYGPSWEQRPPAQGPPPQRSPYPRGYGHGYNEGYNGPQHPYGGHGGSQQTSYPTTGKYPGYGPGEQYGNPSSYGMPPQASQAYGQPRAGEAPYQGSVPPSQSYGSSVAPQQQSYPYASSGPVQQSYPPYNAAPAADGYSQPQPATATGPTYPQQAIPPVTGYAQPVGQQPAVYGQGGAVSGYSSYPSQQGYTEQPAAASAGYGYQGQGDAYATQPAAQAAYAPAAGTPQGYDQSGAASGGYGAPAGAGYGKTMSPHAGFPQYGQTYAAPR